MPGVARVGDPSVEQKKNDLFAVFELSGQPDQRWIGFFKARAIYSTFQEARIAVFQGNRVRIGLSRIEDLQGLTQAVDRFIQGANLDWANLGGSSSE